MIQNRKKVMALFLCLVMCLSLFPATALADAEIMEEPFAEELIIEEPIVEEPAVEEPVVEEPAVEEPAVEEPAVEEPVVEEPAVEEPIVEEPAEDPTEPTVPGDGEEAPVEVPAEEEDEEPSEEPVRVIFVCDPEDLTLTVYTLDENGDKRSFEPEEDGSYLLLPGEYFYEAECEGYETVRETLLVSSLIPEDEVVLTICLNAVQQISATEQVKVKFVCSPEDAHIEVYDCINLNEAGKPTLLTPEDTGYYMLRPGLYFYNASRDGYIPLLEIEFEVQETENEDYIETIDVRLIDGAISFILPSASMQATKVDGSPNPYVELSYTTSTPVGTIRYISQVSGSQYFYSSYWGSWASQAGIECGTASISMAVSYVGVNKTPKDILDYGNGTTYFGTWGSATHSSPSFSTAMSNYINGKGKYSPPVIHFPNGTLTSAGHYAVISGQISSTQYSIVDPAYGIGTITINGTSWSYRGASGSIDQVHQWYNPSASLPDPTYYLDLNGYLDGTDSGSLGSYGTVDVYINGSLDAAGVTDYYKAWPAGTRYEFKNIKANPGYQYLSVYSGSLSGTIGTSLTRTVLSFATSYALTYKMDSGDQTFTVLSGMQQLGSFYDKRNGEYFIGFSYSPNAAMFDVRPGEYIEITKNTTLYPVYISHAEAISGEPVLIYNINDFPSSGYIITPTTKDVTINVTEADWGPWSSWSTSSATGSATRQVETTTLYRYYYFYCPVCGGHEPFQGMSDCGRYTITAGDYHGQWFTTAYSNSSYKSFSYTTKKYYTSSLGDGQIWCFSSGNVNQTAVGTIDADGSEVVIKTGYRYRDLQTSTSTVIKTFDAYIIRAITTYTVTYNANGGTGAPASQTKAHGTALTLSSEMPSRSNASAGSYTVTLNANGGSVSTSSLSAARTTSYSFRNWNTAANGSGTSYNPGASYTANADVTLYAQWNSSTTTAAVTLPTPTRSGYSFQGWATSSSASSGVTRSYTPTGNVTLYAIWEAGTYTVTYIANGGTGAPASQTKTHNVALTLSGTKPTRANVSAGSYTVTLNANGGSVSTSSLSAARTTSYSFRNWNTAANGSGTSYNPGASYTANADVTLYAQWNSSTTTAAVTLPTPTRSGYSFQGWATSSSASNGVTGSYTPTGNVTLYAIWKEEGTTSGTLSLGSVRGAPGSEVTLELTLDKNPGIMMLSFRLSYDKNKLQYLGGEDGSLTGWSFSTTGDGVLWDGDNDSTATGTIVKLHFKILESAVEGETSITLNALEAWNYNEEGISFGTSAGKVTISKRIPGDTTGDGKVNGLDLIRLRKHLAGDDVQIDLSNADVTGDGKVNGLDLIRLRKYLAGDNVVLN